MTVLSYTYTAVTAAVAHVFNDFPCLIVKLDQRLAAVEPGLDTPAAWAKPAEEFQLFHLVSWM